MEQGVGAQHKGGAHTGPARRDACGLGEAKDNRQIPRAAGWRGQGKIGGWKRRGLRKGGFEVR